MQYVVYPQEQELLFQSNTLFVWLISSQTLFVWLISPQPTVLFSQNKPATSNQPAVFFSQNKSAPVISHQPNKQAVNLTTFDIQACNLVNAFPRGIELGSIHPTILIDSIN
jgi:hypothetical protein